MHFIFNFHLLHFQKYPVDWVKVVVVQLGVLWSDTVFDTLWNKHKIICITSFPLLWFNLSKYLTECGNFVGNKTKGINIFQL